MAPQDRPRISKRYADFVGNPDNYSGRINSIVGRYQAVIAEGMPELTEREWLAIMDANNGTVFPGPDESTEIDPARYAWMNVQDSVEDGLNEKWQIDCLDLARKMKSMTYVEQCGVMEVIGRFWERSEKIFESSHDSLIDAGAKIAQKT
jgi:hypothetical protein